MGVIPGIGGMVGLPVRPLTWSVEGASFDPANLTNYSFASLSLGAAADNRYIIALVHKFTVNNSNPVTSVTIAGVAATKLASKFQWNIDQAPEASIWIAAVPTGTTGTVAVNSSLSNSQCGVQLIRVLGCKTTAFDKIEQGDNGATSSGTIDVPAGGLLLALISYGQSTGATRGGSHATRDGFQFEKTAHSVSVTTVSGGSTSWTGADRITDNKEAISARMETALAAVSLSPV